jgi:uncharacterized membrane protein YeaQ/YmgE (transglycosylase-associated protein family)
MEDKVKHEVQDQPGSINYLLAVIGALGGAAIGIAIWVASAYFTDSFYYITPVVVGMLAGTGATKLGGGHNLMTAIIALIFGVIGIAVGDALESAALFKTLDLTVEDYIGMAQLKFEDMPIRYLTHIGGIIAAFAVGLLGADRN